MVRKGVSLAETVISLMLLITAFFIIVRLFHTGMRYLSQAEKQSAAVLIAERGLEEARAWAEQGRNFDNWSGYPAGPRPVTDFPGYTLEVRTASQGLKSPASGFEDLQAVADQRSLSASCQCVEATVRWDSNRKSTRLVTFVGEPVREWRGAVPVEVQPSGAAPNPLPRNTAITLSARGFDSSNQEIRDLFFTWYVLPNPGNGTLTQSRDGRTATFTNVVNVPLRPPLYTGGSVIVRARAVYRGQERVGDFPIDLVP